MKELVTWWINIDYPVYDNTKPSQILVRQALDEFNTRAMKEKQIMKPFSLYQ